MRWAKTDLSQLNTQIQPAPLCFHFRSVWPFAGLSPLSRPNVVLMFAWQTLPALTPWPRLVSHAFIHVHCHRATDGIRQHFHNWEQSLPDAAQLKPTHSYHCGWILPSIFLLDGVTVFSAWWQGDHVCNKLCTLSMWLRFAAHTDITPITKQYLNNTLCLQILIKMHSQILPILLMAR